MQQVLASRSKIGDISNISDTSLNAMTVQLMTDIDGFDTLAQSDAKKAFGVLIESLDLEQLHGMKLVMDEGSDGGKTDFKLKKMASLLFANSGQGDGESTVCKLIGLGAKIDGIIETMELIVYTSYIQAQQQDPAFNLGVMKIALEKRIAFKTGQAQGVIYLHIYIFIYRIS